MAHWKEIKHTVDTKGKTEHYTLQLWLKFPKESKWNDKEESPVVEISYSDRKYEYTYWIDKEKSKSWTVKPTKSCVITVNYIQRHAQVVLYSGTKSQPDYNEFTLEYCKREAERIFVDRLSNLINQIK
jgi:outer membrane lipoprotein-sorting protein